jgi:indolepyruvate ferredoxin oxidoreductase beta subunit
MKKTKTTNVLVVGVGGQGIIRLSDILAEVAFEAGFAVKKSEIHGLSQRGGSVTSHVRWGPEVHSPVIMDGQADYLLGLEELETLRNVHYICPAGTVLVNDFRVLPASVVSGGAAYPDNIDDTLSGYGNVVRFPATDIARQLGNIRASNTVLLGLLSRYVELPAELWERVLKRSFPEKHVEMNLKAFEAGRTTQVQTVVRQG